MCTVYTCAGNHVTDRTVFILFESLSICAQNSSNSIEAKRTKSRCEMFLWAFVQRATHWLCADDYDEMHGIFIDVPSIFLLCFVNSINSNLVERCYLCGVSKTQPHFNDNFLSIFFFSWHFSIVTQRRDDEKTEPSERTWSGYWLINLLAQQFKRVMNKKLIVQTCSSNVQSASQAELSSAISRWCVLRYQSYMENM